MKKTASVGNLVRAALIGIGANTAAIAATNTELPWWARAGITAGAAGLGWRNPRVLSAYRRLGIRPTAVRTGLNQVAYTGGGLSALDLAQRRSLGYSSLDPQSVQQHTVGRFAEAAGRFVDRAYGQPNWRQMSNAQIVDKMRSHAELRQAAVNQVKSLFGNG